MAQSDAIYADLIDLTDHSGLKTAEDIIAAHPEMSISMIARKFNLPYGQVARAKEDHAKGND